MSKKTSRVLSILLSTIMVSSYFVSYEPAISNAIEMESGVLNTRSTVAVTGVKLNKVSAMLYPGYVDNKVTLSATAAPSNATVKTIKWTSSNTSVATVNSSGVVTAKASGTTTITAKSNNGKTATCKITVKTPSTNPADYPKPTRAIYLTSPTMKGNDVKFVQAGLKRLGYYTGAIDGSFGPSCKEATIKFQKSNRLSVDGSMGPATQKVFINKLNINLAIAVTSIKLNKTSATIEKGKSTTLSATVAPSNATVKTIKWTSSNTKVATVDSKGVVKGIASGAVIITAKSNNRKIATCKVTVKNSSTNSATDKFLKVINYKQYDDKLWKNIKLGSSNANMYYHGCTTVAVSILENYRTQNKNINPLYVRSKVKYTSQGYLDWASISKVAGATYQRTKFTNYTEVYNKVKSGKPVIIGVASSSTGTPNHWVVIHGYEKVKLDSNGKPTNLSASNFLISDPARRTARTLADLHKIASKYSKNSALAYYK